MAGVHLSLALQSPADPSLPSVPLLFHEDGA